MRDKKVITRVAPSPTGNLHIGTARTALFNYLYAKHHGGEFIIRVEDTDKERSEKKYEENILESLKWLGIPNDGVYKQSERTEIYKKYLQKLIDSGSAYISKEESKNEPGKEVEVVRLKNPKEEVIFNDEIRGEIKFDTTDLGDFVIARSIDDPLYHLAVVVDDFEMGVTHVIRGEDHISNTPRQILIQRALGIDTPPIYAHMPLILATDRSKLSKRKGARPVTFYEEEGYLPEAFNNYLALLGWNPGTDREIFNMEELIKEFSLEKMHKGGAIFDIEKLNWMNGEYLRKMSCDDIRKKITVLNLSDGLKDVLNSSDAALNDVLERVDTLNDIEKEDLSYYTEVPEYDLEKLVWKDSTKEETVKHLNEIFSILEKLNDFKSEKVKESIWDYATEQGRGSVLWPMRYTLSGKDKSPAPFLLAEILGKEETLSRIKNVVQLLNA